MTPTSLEPASPRNFVDARGVQPGDEERNQRYAAQKLPYRTVVAVLDVARGSGAERVGIVRRHP